MVLIAATHSLNVLPACSETAPTPAAFQTDLANLQSHLTLPPGVQSARWNIAHIQDHRGVPSPGTAKLFARLQFSPEAMTQTRAIGTWNAAPNLPAELLTLQHPEPAPAKLFHSVSKEPGKTMIHGSTWMLIELWAAPDQNTLYFIAEKS